MVQQSAQKSMMQGLGRRRILVRMLDLGIGHKGLEQSFQMPVAEGGNKLTQRAPQGVNVFGRAGKIIGKFDLRILERTYFVERELETAVEFIDEPADFDEVILLEAVDVVGDVVPHLGFHMAVATGQDQRQIKLATLLWLGLFRHDDKLRRYHLILKTYGFGNIKIFHEFSMRYCQ